MISVLHYTLQIVLLAVGFGVGYLILITANKQEAATKNIGQTLAWILIAMAMVLEYLVAIVK